MNIVRPVLLLLAYASGLAMVLASPMYQGQVEQGKVDRDSSSFLQPRERRYAIPGMHCLTLGFLKNLKARFVAFMDSNNDGNATKSEIYPFLQIFNPNVTEDRVDKFIARRDQNGNGILEFVPEYVEDMAAPDMTLEGASEWFGLEDNDGDGYVTRQELMGVARRMGMTSEEAYEHVSTLYLGEDTDGDGKLSFDEYKRIYGQ